LFRVRDHVKRLRLSSKIMRMELQVSDDDLVAQIHELAQRSGFREDVYVRPMVYKSSEVLGVRMHDLDDDYLLYLTPFGAYLDPDAGARCMTSSWRRVDDTAIPARAKVNGLYVNNAMAKTEAQLSGFDEAILLNQDGHVSEGSGENIAIIRDGVIITPPPQDNILEGITLETALQVAREHLGLDVLCRSIDRSELYIADEVLMTGTAAHVTPVVEVDRVPVGDGQPGKVTKQLRDRYFKVITGRLPEYLDWLTPVYSDATVSS
jgi:branched-chain amino acid aminotransferase